MNRARAAAMSFEALPGLRILRQATTTRRRPAPIGFVDGAAVVVVSRTAPGAVEPDGSDLVAPGIDGADADRRAQASMICLRTVAVFSDSQR